MAEPVAPGTGHVFPSASASAAGPGPASDDATGPVTLHVESDGEGPLMVLIAGMASDSSSWGGLVAPLAARFRVLRPDNRGTGRTRPAHVPILVQLCAADLAALIEAEDAGPAHLVGHSMGGMIALELAATRPDLVRGLTLLASAPLRSARNDHVMRTLVALREPGMPADLWLKSFYPWLFRPDFFANPGIVAVAVAFAVAYPHAQSPEAFAAQVAALESFDPGPLPARIRCPVQAVLGAEDLLYPVGETAAVLRAAFPGLEPEIIPEAAHALHWDAPIKVAEAILSFADSPASGAG